METNAFMTSSIGDLPINSEGLRKAVDEIARLKSENAALKERLEKCVELPIALEYGETKNCIGYGFSETQKLTVIEFGIIEHVSNYNYIGEDITGKECQKVFAAYFKNKESLSVLKKCVEAVEARFKEWEERE
jgi:hypothetical protein